MRRSNRFMTPQVHFRLPCPSPGTSPSGNALIQSNQERPREFYINYKAYVRGAEFLWYTNMEKEADKPHVLVLPFHGQGHINPMLQFSKRLASKAVKITLVSTLSSIKTMPPQVDSISFESIYDDITDGGFQGVGGLMGFMERFQSAGVKNVRDVIKRYQDSSTPIKCLVYDGNLPWGLDVAKEVGILGAAFFTQSCAAIALYLEIFNRKEGSSEPLPELGLSKMARVGSDSILSLILTQFSNLDGADWVLFNSFNKLEEEVIENLLKLYPVRTIGPTVPSMYLDKRLEEDKDYGFSLYQSTGDTCTNWLNTKEIGSVVYVSFGSAAKLSGEQMEELAWGLKQSNNFFLWVVRASEENKLPPTFNDDTLEKGLVVTWSPQLEVLSHKAVGCFMTHCGWNSTVEGVSLGVPMLAMPQFLDQFTDAKFVEDVWEVGVRPKDDESKGLVTRNEIEKCIREVMEGEKSEKIKKNSSQWRELAKEAVDAGGSSDRNIDEIVARLQKFK